MLFLSELRGREALPAVRWMAGRLLFGTDSRADARGPISSGVGGSSDIDWTTEKAACLLAVLSADSSSIRLVIYPSNCVSI
jgi:hypothetical protein